MVFPIGLNVLRTTALILMISSSALADLASVTPSDQKIESIPLAQKVILKLGGKEVSVVPVATGLRKKKVALFWPKIYVTEVFAPSKEGLDKSSGSAFLEGLLKQKTIGIRLTFTRKVSANQTMTGLKDGLKANGFDPEAAAYKPLFEAVAKAGENTEGKSLWLVGAVADDGSEKAYIEGTSRELQTLSLEKGTLRQVLLIWFGKPADGGLEELQKALLKP